MTDGLKTGLILGGAAVIGYMIVRSGQSSTTLPGSTTTTPAPTGFSAFLQQVLGHAPGSGVAPTTPATSATPAPAPSSSSSGLKSVASTFWNADKAIVGGAYSAAVGIDKAVYSGGKTVVKGALGVASSAIHSIASLF